MTDVLHTSDANDCWGKCPAFSSATNRQKGHNCCCVCCRSTSINCVLLDSRKRAQITKITQDLLPPFYGSITFYPSENHGLELSRFSNMLSFCASCANYLIIFCSISLLNLYHYSEIRDLY